MRIGRLANQHGLWSSWDLGIVVVYLVPLMKRASWSSGQTPWGIWHNIGTKCERVKYLTVHAFGHGLEFYWGGKES